MKKNYLLLGLLSLGMITLQSCDENSNEMEKISPVEQKERLQNIGMEVLNKIDATDFQNIADVADFISAEIENAEIDEELFEKLESLTSDGEQEPEPLRAINSLMALSLDMAQNRTSLTEGADDVYTLTVDAGLNDIYGALIYEDGYLDYDESVTDRLELQFTDNQNQNWVVTLAGSEETTEISLQTQSRYSYESKYEDGYTYTEEDNEDYNFFITVPKQVSFVATCNRNKVVDLQINSDLAFEASIYESSKEVMDYEIWEFDYNRTLNATINYTNINVEASLYVNNYKETFKSSVDDKGVYMNIGFDIDGKNVATANFTLNANVPKFIQQLNASEDDTELNTQYINSFVSKIDVLGKAQLVAKADDFGKFYDAFMEDDDHETFEEYQQSVAKLNNAYKITLHYDNTSTVQATIESEAFREVEYDYEYWGYKDVIVFSEDGSRHDFEDYFDEESFDRIFNKVDDLFDSLDNMFGNIFDYEEDDYEEFPE